MKSGVPWQVTGVRRRARDTAREAARRSGVSVGEWLDNAILDSALHDGVDPRRGVQPEYGPYEGADIGPYRSADREDDARPVRGRYADYGRRRDWTPDDDRAPLVLGDYSAVDHDHRDDRDHPASSWDHRQPVAGVDHRAMEPAEPGAPKPAEQDEASAADQDLVEVKDRLDSLTLQLSRLVEMNATKEHISPADLWNAEPPRQLVEAISRIDSRLDELTEERRSVKAEMTLDANAADRTSAEPVQENPGPAVIAQPPITLDQALIEIADRQRALDGYPPVAPTHVIASESLPRAYTQELSGLEQQLRQINTQIEALRQPSGLEQAVETLRNDLAEIGRMVQDAVPRNAIEALESEVRKLAERLDGTHSAGTDGAASAGVERGLAEVRDALSALTPAENLVGVDQAIQQLSQKIDTISSNTPDPTTLKQLEGAIATMRSLVSHVASNEALAKLSDEVRTLGDKIGEGIGPASGTLSALEGRIAMLADALEARNRNGQNVPEQIETVVNGLADKIERMQLTRGDQAALGHLEDRIAKLVEKLDASDVRLDHLETIERGLADLLVHLESQRGANSAPAAPAALPGVDALLRDVADLKQTEKRTRDSLEAVHGTLGHVVDRLAVIETDLRATPVRPAGLEPAPREFAPAPAPVASLAPKPPVPEETATPALDAHAAAVDTAELPLDLTEAAVLTLAPKLPVDPPQPNELAGTPQPIEFAPQPPNPPAAVLERRAIDPSLPPDHPLEPGSGIARGRSPADRIAASQAALAATQPSAAPDPNGKANFIAAARRAAQAASRDAPIKNDPSPRGKTSFAAGGLVARAGGRRTLIMAAIAVLIVLGLLQIARNLLGASDQPDVPGQASAISAPDAPPATNPVAIDDAPADGASPPAPPATPAPSAPAPGRQSTLSPGVDRATTAPSGAPAETEATAATSLPAPIAAPTANRDITGSLSQPAKPALGRPPAAPAVQPSSTPASPPTAVDHLPAAFGSTLRAAAGKGDPAAQYEIAMRYAEGRGVPQNPADAVEWLERAAKRGFAPAQFRLGGFYEKGFGVAKNLETARQLYLAAGEAGNAKALHNLAVLYAEGIDGRPDYRTAAKWFRKAADYGVVDAQYNLAVLFTRGIGVEQNLGEAYKWFALAARDGDTESAKKRDEIGARLDRQALEAVNLAVQAWTIEPQPDAAVQVKTPPGGWEGAAATPSKRKSQLAGPKLDLATPRPAQ